MNDTARTQLTLWVTLLLLTGVAAVLQIRFSLSGGPGDNMFGQALVASGSAWLTGTLPVVLAGGLAIAMTHRRGRLLLAGCLVLGSTAVEIVGYAAWVTLSSSSIGGWRAAIYAVSATLLAAAWLAARAWYPASLLASPIAGIASFFVIPKLTGALYSKAELWWGAGTESRFIGLAAGFALELLILSFPAIVLLSLRKIVISDK